MRPALLAPLTAFVISCIPAADYATGPAPTIDLTLLVDPAFPVDEQRSIAEGARDWMNVTAGITIHVLVEPCQGTASENAVCVVPELGEDMEAEWHCSAGPKRVTLGCYVKSSNLILLDRWHLNNDDLRLVTAHEIGHKLGLKHAAEGTLMSDGLDHDMTPPTCKDVAALWKVHGGVPAPCRLRRIFGAHS